MRRWQYKVVVKKVLANPSSPDTYEDSEREQFLNAYGQDGWELVSVIFQRYQRDADPLHSFGFTVFSYFLKRPLEDNDDGAKPRTA